MNFADAARNEAKTKLTTNGMVAYNTTENGLLDLFAIIGALRNADVERIQSLFAEAYKEDPLIATKILFYGRDVRGGLGERNTFKIFLKYVAQMHPEALRNNISLIPEYGRWDDLYALIDTPLEADMWSIMKTQFIADERAIETGDAPSLLGKWLKSVDASSEKSKQLGIKTAKAFGVSVYAYKRKVRTLRKAIKIVEAQMSANKWDEIDYPAVPSRAAMIYREAFKRHDEERYSSYIQKAVTGKEKINSGTLYPYDLIKELIDPWKWSWGGNIKNDSTVEAQWRQLPNYVESGTNALVIADTSGSMDGQPICSALGLALYFAERNIGAFHGMFMNFSDDSSIQIIKGETLAQKLQNIDYNHWGCNTNIEAAMNHILSIGIKNHVSADEMPKALIIISDMEFDSCSNGTDCLDMVKQKFSQNGYEIPNIIFWNVNSTHDTFHASANVRGVQLVSGQSASTFKNLVGCIGMTPLEMMLKVINSDRYKAITIA